MSDAERAVELVREADTLLVKFARPGRWPQARTVRRFDEAEVLETVLALYSTAMKLAPTEPAYPWNLAGSLHRLGHSEIALSFIGRALTLARETNDEDLTGAGAYIAWADMATSAGHYDAALVALARANALAGDPSLADGSESIRSAIRRLKREIARLAKRPKPEHELAQQLEALSA